VIARENTCISDEQVGSRMAEWVAHCGHGLSWKLGATREMCEPCVQGVCNHQKHGRDIEQLLLGETQ
jgi:hypothetical protein